ncbi:Lipase3 [Aspergillus parasiticus SU-1]|uniref:feruloyl esterase n=1 Tax=Aspergillus parasiticus (strain ATCC 56775 / NRRL 5862 / SRRC 143 / SU-1) TaxID=1403190 RepID=A0A0F0I0J5_ASPPU|nr:Lipase3 [Aspergillus parasiticus SU-1]
MPENKPHSEMPVILCFLVASESLIKLTSASGISEETFQDLQRAAKLSSAAYAKCDTNAYDVTITKHINDIATGTQGYIGYSTSRKAISLVFRGSTTVIDFVNDLDSTTVSPTIPDTHFPTGAKIMQGIHRPWLAVHDDVISEIRNLLGQYPEFSLESMGHSLGGSLTYLSYIVLRQSFPHTNITGYALAAFPVGNQEFADLGTMQGGICSEEIARAMGHLMNMLTNRGISSTMAWNTIAMVQEKELFNAREIRIQLAQQEMESFSRLWLTFTSLVLILAYWAPSPNVIKLNFALSFRVLDN